MFEYTSTIADTYGDTFITCLTDLDEKVRGFDVANHHCQGKRRGCRPGRHTRNVLRKTVRLPEIRFEPVLMESRPDLDKMRCLPDQERKEPGKHQLTFRSNPLPELKLLITNHKDHVWSNDEVDFNVCTSAGHVLLAYNLCRVFVLTG